MRSFRFFPLVGRSRHTSEEDRLLENSTGTVIPAVMVSGINSGLPVVIRKRAGA